MEKFLSLLETYPMLRLVVILAVVAIIVSIIGKLFRVAVAVAVVAIMISVFSTILLGDGTEYVREASQFLPEQYQEQVNDAYQDYRERASENPIIDYDEVKDRIDRAREIADQLGESRPVGEEPPLPSWQTP